MASTTSATPVAGRPIHRFRTVFSPPVERGRRRMRALAIALLIGHLMALVFGLAGLLVAIPHPELWSDTSLGPKVFDFGIRYGGATHILFGAAAMFAYGVYAIGFRKTIIFFLCAVPISLGSELIGTSTGEPFGNYAYTNFLGYKVLGHVPYSIPLSWFYVGFATALIGYEIARRLPFDPRWLTAVTTGAALLVVWDLVLDPAMAHDSLTVKFWEWGQTGPYFGMPLQNFAGWGLTAFLFMAVARLLWRRDPADGGPIRDVWFPVAVYYANIVFAAVISIDVGLWLPIGFAVVMGVLPAMAALTRWGLSPDDAAPSEAAKVLA